MITMQTTGGPELLEALSQLSTRVSTRVQREALRDAAEPLRRRMARLAPHEPGLPDLRDNIVISNAKGRDTQEVGIAVGPSLKGFYGSFQEFGTSRHRAQPFMRPAFDQEWVGVVKDLGRAIWTILAGRGIRRRATVSLPPIQPGSGRLV